MKRFMINHPGAWWYLCVIALLLGGCATQTPASLSHKLYTTERAITESWLLATDLRKQGKINDSDWPKVVEGLDQATDEIKAAWIAYDADPEAAAESYGTAQEVLDNIGRAVPALKATLAAH